MIGTPILGFLFRPRKEKIKDIMPFNSKISPKKLLSAKWFCTLNPIISAVGQALIGLAVYTTTVHADNISTPLPANAVQQDETPTSHESIDRILVGIKRDAPFKLHFNSELRSNLSKERTRQLFTQILQDYLLPEAVYRAKFSSTEDSEEAKIVLEIEELAFAIKKSMCEITVTVSAKNEQTTIDRHKESSGGNCVFDDEDLVTAAMIKSLDIAISKMRVFEGPKKVASKPAKPKTPKCNDLSSDGVVDLKGFRHGSCRGQKVGAACYFGEWFQYFFGGKAQLGTCTATDSNLTCSCER